MTAPPRYDSFAMLDWSGGNDTDPRPRRDAIWMGLVRAGAPVAPRYLRNRVLAEAALTHLIGEELRAGRRLLIGVDFPFGFPSGFAIALTGRPDPLHLWNWFEERIEDTPRANNRFDVAARINGCFPGIGPFWFNPLRRDIPDLPRRDTRAGHGLPERREADRQTKGAFPCWQMGGAGAVGGQILTGLPVLARLRRRFAAEVAVWPFERLTRPVTFVETWPGLIETAVRQAQARGGIRDSHQVRLMSLALSRLPAKQLQRMLMVNAPEEGWILGSGQEAVLTQAATA